jgi:uncharacterized protein (DUF1499 family)
MSQNNIPPLKKWILSNKYFIKSSETKEKKVDATHYLLDGGIWKVPLGEYQEFLRLLSVDLQNGEKYYISENRSKIFKFICDLDFYEDSEITISQIERIVKKIQEVVTEYYSDQHVIICSSDTKKIVINSEEYVKSGFHLVWPKIWISVDHAKELRLKFIEILNNTFGERSENNKWEDVVDLAVYEDNGLRMIGCRKMVPCKVCKRDTRDTCEKCNGNGRIDENRVYKPKSIIGKNVDSEYIKSVISDYYVMLLETSIMNYSLLPETNLIKDLPITITKKRIKKSNNVIQQKDELNTKVENFIKKVYKQTHSKIKVKKITKVDDLKYFIEPDDNFCLNVNRNHTSSGIYFQIKPSGICQRCFCKKSSIDGRISGPCKDFASDEIPLSKILENFLFPGKKNKKNLVNCKLTSSSSFDKNLCLNNCRSILFQLENELI